MRVYLAGPIFGEDDVGARGWRAEARGYWPNAIDPMVRDYRGKEDENVDAIVEGDKNDIDASDVLIAWFGRPSVGTSMEILYAWESCKPVVVVAPPGARISPWLRYHATAVVESLAEAAVILRAIQ